MVILLMRPSFWLPHIDQIISCLSQLYAISFSFSSVFFCIINCSGYGELGLFTCPYTLYLEEILILLASYFSFFLSNTNNRVFLHLV